MNREGNVITIKGCFDCPLRHKLHSQGFDDYWCVMIEKYAPNPNTEEIIPEYIDKDCPFIKEKTIIIERAQ